MAEKVDSRSGKGLMIWVCIVLAFAAATISLRYRESHPKDEQRAFEETVVDDFNPGNFHVSAASARHRAVAH